MTDFNASQLYALCQQRAIQLDLLDEIDSTNRYLESATGNTTRICIANAQSHGRGQRGRRWHSPANENIYFSCRYSYELPPAALSGLSLAVSVVTLGLLQTRALRTPLQIKWPNDILANHRKLAGILVELKQQQQTTIVIVGIGINVNMLPDITQPIDQPWISLCELTGQPIDRHPLYIDLIEKIPDCLLQFQQKGLGSFLDAFRRADCLVGQTVEMREDNQWIEVVAKEIDSEGRLIIQMPDKRERVLMTGEVRLRQKSHSV